MIAPDRADQRIEALLEALAPRRQPDYLAAVQASARTVRQRPAWQFPNRWLPVPVEVSPDARRRLAFVALVGALLMALAIATIVGAPKPKPPPFGPAGNGQIVFEDGADILVANADGSGVHPLVAGPGSGQKPAFSLDGELLAFLRKPPGSERWNLVVAASDGSAPRDVLVPDQGLEPVAEPPAWSPDSRRVAITVLNRTSAAEHAEIWLVDVVSGRHEVFLPENLFSAELPAWSPDGGRLAFLGEPAGEGVGYLYVANIDGSGLMRFASRPSSFETGFVQLPRWSPDGSQIAFHYGDAGRLDRDVVVVSVATRTERTLGGPATDDAQPAWSPDGTHLAFLQSIGGERSWRVAIADLSTDMTRTLSFVLSSAESIRWSPDGRLISISRAIDDQCELDLLDATSSDAVPVRVRQLPCGDSEISTDTLYWSWQRIAPR
jgi:dipeptidyl aminopeptidase/acylaminoacyl peptidase